MLEKDQELIAKYLFGETSEKENNSFLKRMNNENSFKKAFIESEKILKSLQIPDNVFDKERILRLISRKIALNKKEKQNRIIYASIKYAAIFIGLLIISVSVYRDLNSIKKITNNTGKFEKIILPDKTIVTLNKNTTITYKNSTITGFNRKVKLFGEAFFDVNKKEHQRFIVETNSYNINVLGTKFNVRTFDKDNFVVLTEGKILLDNFKSIDNQIVMKPGQIVKFSKQNNTFVLKNINPQVYTSWLSKRIEFDNFSFYELSELFNIRYGKTLIINNSEVMNTYLSGSAPSDDVHLIVKAIKSILKTEVIEKNDTIIIN